MGADVKLNIIVRRAGSRRDGKKYPKWVQAVDVPEIMPGVSSERLAAFADVILGLLEPYRDDECRGDVIEIRKAETF